MSEPPLIQRLSRLTDDIARVRDGHPGLLRRTDRPILRWEDDDYIYLEIDSSGPPELAADISVWEGRVVIRVAR